jgi:Uma2 family endonuclease
VIVEVLSDSTEKYDRGKKSNHYRQIASLKELILIAQDRSHVERFTRQPNGDWLFHEQKELTAGFELKSLGISIAISELYRGVKFEPIEDDVNASR